MKGDRRRQFVWSLLRFIVKLPFRLFLGFKAKVFKLQKNKPYIILSNHVAQIDPIYLGLSFKRKINFIAYAGVVYGKYQKILHRYFAPIAKAKGKSDLVTIRESLKVIKNNGIVCVFPSGDCTFSGVESYIDKSIVKFVRMMKADLLLYRLDGVYGKSPRWAHKRTKGKMIGQVKKVMTVEEVNSLNDEELYDAIINVIGGNNLDYLDGNLYKGKHCAEYLERALYVCPDCGSISTLESDHKYFSCSNCGYKVEYLPNLHFKLLNGHNLYETVYDWYNYCINALKEKEANNEFSSDNVLFKDSFKVLEKQWLDKENDVYERKEQIVIEEGFISLYRDCFIIENKLGNQKIKLFIKDSKVIFHGKSKLVIYNDDITYTIEGFERFCGMKYIHFVNEVIKS